MIPDNQRSLLTEAVDGELSAPRTRALKKLLDASPDARALHAKLCADRDRLKNLPRVKPPADLRARILAKLPAPKPIIEPRREPVRPAARSWVPLAVAASVMLCLGGGSFWFFARETGTTPSTGKPTETARGAGRVNYADVLPPENGRPPSAPIHHDDSANNVAHDFPQPREVHPVEVIPAPRAVNNFNASPLIPDAPPFDLVQVRLPFLVPLTDLDRDDVQKKLIAELGRESASRIDVFVKDTGRGGEAFLAAAKASGLTVFADATATERMKRRMPGSFVVYAESLTAADVRDLFVKLSAEDAKATQRTFDSLHVVGATAGDHKELKDVLGFDPGPWKRAERNTPSEPKSISAGTGEQVAKSVSGGGAKATEKPAVLMSFGPAASRTPPVMSKELKQYGEKRGERKPTSVPVMIVIRVAG